MQNTSVAASFTNADTIQLRFELGQITQAQQTTTVPTGADPDNGWIWQDGRYIGRVGLDGKTFMPVDTYAPSVIDDLFDAPQTDATRMAAVDDLSRWTVTVNGETVQPLAISRKANIAETAQVQWGEYAFETIQNVFVTLSTPLNKGDNITVTFNDPDFEPIAATFDPDNVISEAIHVNVRGFDPDDGHKVAYLSSWNGWQVDSNATDGGTPVAQNYAGPVAYSVIDEATGRIVLQGQTTLGTAVSQPSDFDRNFAQTDVWEIDLAALDTVGTYHVVVDGVGRSTSFDVAETHWNDVFKTAFSGFYHQRSGIELTSDNTPWTHPRSLHPDDGLVTVYASDLKITDTDEGYDTSKPDQFGPLVALATDEVIDGAWGGWHDAGDWDRRPQHMEAARKLIELVELAPDWAAATDGNIPESGDAVPDLLDEAAWGLSVFARMQTADGGIRGGIEGDNYRGYGASSWTEAHTLYAYAPDVWSSWEFAASAAKLAKALKPYDATAAAEWLTRAERAMTWAEARVPVGDDYDVILQTSRNLAGAELYGATGKAKWHDVFLETTIFKTANPDAPWNGQQYEASFVYNRLTGDLVDDAIAANGLANLKAQADFLLDRGTDGGFGYIADPYAPYGWGNTASSPMNAARFMATTHALTGEVKYLEAMQADIQYGLGANPLNMAFLTGLGGREAQTILNADVDASGTTPPSGIALYGDYNIYDYGYGWFHDVMWGDLFPNPYQAPVNESFQGFWGFVPSTEYTVQQGITDMTFVAGYLAALQDPADIGGPPNDQGWLQVTPPEPGRRAPGSDILFAADPAVGETRGTGRANDIIGSAGGDVIKSFGGDDWVNGASGNDLILVGAGDDRARGAGGNDILSGGTGDDALFGDGGQDRLNGGDGNDWLIGGRGDDRLRGGAGADHFAFQAGGGLDRVVDFEVGIDRLVLDANLWDGSLTQQDVLDAFGRFTAGNSRLILTFDDTTQIFVRANNDTDLRAIVDDLALM